MEKDVEFKAFGTVLLRPLEQFKAFGAVLHENPNFNKQKFFFNSKIKGGM